MNKLLFIMECAGCGSKLEIYALDQDVTVWWYKHLECLKPKTLEDELDQMMLEGDD